MFREVRQCGFIPVLQSFGSSPLESWEMKVQNGWVRRVTDEQVRALALEIAGTNVSTCYVYCPKSRRQSLGIHMPYLVMTIKSLKKYFTFEVTVLDDRNVHRRFRMSNFQKMNHIHHFCTSMPLCLNPGWNEMYFDLADFTRKAYNTNYIETTRLQIHANCRIRVIYFCDRIYNDKDIPQKYKIFLPLDHVGRRKSTEEVLPEKKEVSKDDVKAESQLFDEDAGEEEEEEEMDLEESLKSLEEMTREKIEEKSISGGEDEQLGLSTIIDEFEGEERSGEENEDEEEIIKEEEQQKTETQEASDVKEEAEDKEDENNEEG